MSQANPGQHQAQLQRDRRLRHKLLAALHEARANEHGGYVSARFLVDALSVGLGPSEGFDSSDHALALLRDLELKGYAESRDFREYASQQRDATTVSFRVTGQGAALMNEAIEPDGDIDDDRRR